MNAMHVLFRIGIAAAAGVLGACESVPNNPFSTAAAMVVEVEVYKGPLTKTPAVQLGELEAVLHQADKLLEVYVNGMQRFWDQRCRGLPGYDCKLTKQMLDRGVALHTNVRALGVRYRSFSPPVRDLLLDKPSGVSENERVSRLRQVVVETTDIATRLKIEAFYWAEVQITDFPEDRDLRAFMVGFTNLASELSNQLAARTDALSKQFDQTTSLKREVLPISDYLKSAGPTDFLHLYDWYNAVSPDESGQNNLTSEDRVRLAKRLFADHFWTKINEVHASGQGEVRMALIKDDIGNWNLKSFDNDPEQLVKAYRDLTSAGIAAAIKLAQNLGTGGTAAGIDLIGQFARGRVGSAPILGADRLDTLRARAVEELNGVKQRITTGQEPLQKAEQAAKVTYEEKQGTVTTARGEYEKARTARRNLEDAIKITRESNANATPESLKPLNDKLDGLRKTEAERADELRNAEKDQATAKASYDAAQNKHRQYMTSAVEEAKTAIRVHQRVVEGLKEIQTTPTSNKPLVPPPPGQIPGSNVVVNPLR